MSELIKESIGIELNKNAINIICLEKLQNFYRVKAAYQEPLSLKGPKFCVQNLIMGFRKQLPQLRLANMPIYMTLADEFYIKKTIDIEGDILRLKPQIIDAYVFARAEEYCEQALTELYFDYVILQPENTRVQQARVLLAWAEKSVIRPYLHALKTQKIKLGALETAELSYKRFSTQIVPIQGLVEGSDYINCAGAALRAWSCYGA